MDNLPRTPLDNLIFRRAALDDLDAYLPLRMAMLAEVSALPPEPLLTELWNANRLYFQECLPKETYLAWLAESREETIAIGGVLLFNRPPTAENMAGLDGYVMNMYTLPGWRGRGIASRLMQLVIDEMRLRRAARLWLHATSPGRPVYERFGFMTVNQSPLPHAVIEMELSL